MMRTRTLILLLAVASGCGSALLVRRNAVPPAVPSAPSAEPMREVLVMGRAAEAGEAVGPGEVRWRAWPQAHLPAGAISRTPGAAGPAFEAAVARYPLIEGEPVAEARLTRPGKGSALAAITGAGQRAVAVPLREESAAGGLIQPGDRVDVIWTPGAGDNLADRPAARTLLRRVKVLAIGKSLAPGGRGEARTATLELTPAEARTIAGVRTRGEITLAIVPATDVGTGEGSAEETADAAPAVRIIRFGR